MEKNELQVKAELCHEYYNEVMSGGHWKYFDQKSEEKFEDFQSVIEALKQFGAVTQADTLKKAVALWKQEKQLIAENEDEEGLDELQEKYDELDLELNCKPSVTEIVDKIYPTGYGFG